jgi:hypothetical protein
VVIGRTTVRRAVTAGVAALALQAAVPAPRGLAAQEARLSNSVDTTLVTVGDRVRMTVLVEHAAGARVAWPDSLDLSPFEVLGAEALPPAPQGERVRWGAVLVLTVFELGELEIPSFDITVEGPGDQVQTLSTDRFGIEVVTVGADEGGDIRDIRGPLGIPVGIVRVSLWLLLLLGAVAAAVWLMRRRKGGDDMDVPAGPPPRPAHEVALEELARIEASPMLERGQVKEYHIEVSEALRTYVEGRFMVPSLEMTTREVVVGLRSSTAPDGFIDGLARFLDQCDMVKFAKVRPDADACRAVLALGRELVESTVPEEEPQVDDEAP